MCREEFNFLDFIDSADIREYNKNYPFTPAQQAVLVSLSEKKTVEEKVSALKYIMNRYTDNEMIEESVHGSRPENASLRDTISETVRIWEEVLQARDDNEKVVYAVKLNEKDFPDDTLTSARFFSTYEAAYDSLLREKTEDYWSDEDLKDTETYGVIYRLELDEDTAYADGDRYCFDSEMRLVRVLPAYKRYNEEVSGESLIDFKTYVPLPFRPGDIVKEESPFSGTSYGVFSCEHTEPREMWLATMFTSIDLYISSPGEKIKFDYTDDTNILSLSYCTDEELPEDQKVLKLLRKVRKGKLDFIALLHSYDDFGDLLKWVR